MAEWGWISGDHWVICDKCGFKKRKSQIVISRTLQDRNMVVCSECYDPPHPLDYAKVPKIIDKPRPVRTRQISYRTQTCTPTNKNGVVGEGVVGCMIVGLDANV
jgi:hypothetical protein